MARTQWNTINKDALDAFMNYAVCLYDISAKFEEVRVKIAKKVAEIESNEDDLKAIKDGTYDGHRTPEEIQANIDDLKARNDKFRAARNKYADKMSKDMAPALDLVKGTYSYYKNRENDVEAYEGAIKDLVKGWGVNLTDSTLKVIMTSVGFNKMSNGAIGRTIGRNAKLEDEKKKKVATVKNLAEKTYCEVLVRVICDMIGLTYEKIQAVKAEANQ